MPTTVESVTTAALSLALDAASLRQQAIAANLANANTPGYAPVAVSFEEQLGEARRSLQDGGRIDAATLEGVQPRLQEAPAVGGVRAGLSIDTQAMELAQNSVHFQALLKGLSRHYALLATAVGDGRK